MGTIGFAATCLLIILIPAYCVEGLEEVPENCLVYNRGSSPDDKVPYTKLAHGFEEGKILSINASIKSGAKRFVLDILNANHAVAFHMSIRLSENKIILSERSNKVWFRHVTIPALNNILKPDQPFKIDVIRRAGDFWVYIDDSLVETYSPTSFSNYGGNLSVAYFNVFGDVSTKTICYKDDKTAKHTMLDPSFLLAEDCENKLQKEKIYKIPYMKLPVVFSKNESLLVYAKTFPYVKRFVVNLFDEKKVHALHLSFRMDLNLTVISGNNMARKVIRQMPLAMNEEVRLQIVNKLEGYEILVNGAFFVVSMPSNDGNPQYMHIYGDAKVSGLCLKQNTINSTVSVSQSTTMASEQVTPLLSNLTQMDQMNDEPDR